MNLLKDIGSGALQILKTVAPTIAATATGPFASVTLPIFQKLFGTTDPAAIETSLVTATPEQLLALHQEDDSHAEKMEEMGVSKDKLGFDDVASARNMAIQTRDPTAARLAWLIIGGFLVTSIAQLVGLMGFADEVNKIPPQGWLLIGNVSGYLANEAKQAAAFYFGSTAGSQAKDTTIADIAKS